MIKLGRLGLDVSIARCFAFYGKYLPKNQHYAFGNFLNSAEKGDKIIVESPGIIYRSYMEADALVLSLLKVLLISEPSCPIVNIGSDLQISLYDLAKNIAIEYGVDYEFVNYNDKIIIDRYVPNTEKLKKL